MAFRVGMKVACIDANHRPQIYPETGQYAVRSLDGLTQGAVYTVRKLGVCPVWHKSAVWLEEISRTPYRGVEIGFDVRRFRPLAYPKQSEADDIAMIRELVETIDPIVACELTYADEIEARMERIDRLWEAMR